MSGGIFEAYRSANLCVIPSRDGVPLVKWSPFQSALPTDEEARSWDARYPDGSYELVCGAISGVVALDIDTNDAEVIRQVEALAGVSPVKKRGSKGFTAFYRYSGEKTAQWGKVVELLSDKHLTCIPPSLHRRTGKPYEWMGDDATSLLDGLVLPSLPDYFVDCMNSRWKVAPPVSQPPSHHHDEPLELDDAREMLSFISPDCDRIGWIHIGMALRSEYGDFARDLWHRWSSGSQKYNQRDAESAWRSFTGSGVTIGTLIYQAKQGGWRAEAKSRMQDAPEPDLSYLSQSRTQPQPAAKPPRRPAQLPSIPGLVGEIADWITSTAIRPQPLLSLSAALAFMGMVKGHRIRGVTNLRTNMLTLSLAPTSAGKDHPQFCVDQLAEACGLSEHMIGRPTSGTGLLTGINKAGGVALLTVDEMGRYLGNIALKTAGGHQREITDYMIELFSCAGRKFKGRQYADERANPQVVIQQPHFCCVGSSVIERMQAACSGAEVIDGFLNRWLVFCTTERPQKRRGIKYSPPPERLIQRIGEWMQQFPATTDNYGTPEPREVRFTPEAWDMLAAFDDRMLALLDSEPFPINQLYARSAEHAEKLAMVICDEDVIGVSELEAAIAIVTQSNLHISSFAGKISNTQHEADLVYVLDIIREHGTITRNKLTHKTRRLTNRIRADILNQLYESDEIDMQKTGKELVISIRG